MDNKLLLKNRLKNSDVIMRRNLVKEDFYE